MAESSVLITTEGTYPHYGGGVSVWCDQLVSHLPEVDFDVFAIVHSLSQPRRFALPDNVRALHSVPLWGTPRAGLRETGVATTFRRRMRTTSAAIERDFLPSFERALSGILEEDAPSALLGEGLLGVHRFSLDRDYATAMGSRTAWRAFLAACSRHSLAMTLEDATNCMRWMQRYLSVLSVEVPEVDVVHSTMAGLAGLPGVMAKMMRGTPYLLSEHGLQMREMYAALAKGEFAHNSRRFLARFHAAIVRLNYFYADRITALGPYNRRWQIDLGADPAKISIVPNGVDPEIFRPRSAPERERPTVLTMARIFPLKGIEPLLRAAAIVRDRIPNVLFRILGEVADQEYNATCQEIVARHGLQDNISFGVTRENYRVYSEADVYCSPSLSEGMPYAILEAMMSGCPVVATEVGNVREVLGRTGLLVHPNDPAELAAALLETLDGDSAADFRNFLAAAALKRARQQFMLTHTTDGFRNLYEELHHDQSVTALSCSSR